MSYIASMVLLFSVLLPSMLFISAAADFRPVFTDNATWTSRLPGSHRFRQLLSASVNRFNLAVPSRQTYAGSTLDDVYVNGTMGNDSYDGSSPVPLSATVGPKKTIQAGIDTASIDSWVRVIEDVY